MRISPSMDPLSLFYGAYKITDNEQVLVEIIDWKNAGQTPA